MQLTLSANFSCILAAGVQSASTPEAPIMSAPALPPQLDHTYVLTNHHRRVDTLRRTIHALDAQRVLVFMNYQHRLKVPICRLTAPRLHYSLCVYSR